MIDTVQLPRNTRHASSYGIASDIRFVQSESNVDDGREITDSVAAAIAASWQSSSGHGRAFAALIGFFPVDVAELLDAIAYEYPFAVAYPDNSSVELDCLATWAINHPSRTYPF